MRSFSFRNSSTVISSIVNNRAPAFVEEEDSYYNEDLQFSTFRSEDYCFYDRFYLKKEEVNSS